MNGTSAHGIEVVPEPGFIRTHRHPLDGLALHHPRQKLPADIRQHRICQNRINQPPRFALGTARDNTSTTSSPYSNEILWGSGVKGLPFNPGLLSRDQSADVRHRQPRLPRRGRHRGAAFAIRYVQRPGAVAIAMRQAVRPCRRPQALRLRHRLAQHALGFSLCLFGFHEPLVAQKDLASQRLVPERFVVVLTLRYQLRLQAQRTFPVSHAVHRRAGQATRQTVAVQPIRRRRLAAVSAATRPKPIVRC